ncbi:MAG: PspC domain-containing protein [Candidatus Kariarchaeaceae archaeon]|jgi:phage shock protein PspC (stress-responsive transcriptional regulator)
MKCATCGDFLKKDSRYCSSCGSEVQVSDTTKTRFSRPPEKYTGPRKLYRSRSDRLIGGVCGGLGNYYNIDPNILRVLWALFFLSGFGVIAYLLAIVFIPESPLDPWSE